MTEALIVAVTSLAGLFFVDPFFGGGFTKSGFAKAVLLAFGTGAFVLHLTGRALTARHRLGHAAGGFVRDFWPALALGAFITAGGLYARFVARVPENFLAFGLGFLFLPLVALSLATAQHRDGLLRAIGVIAVATMAGMLAVLAARLHTFHEEIFFAVALAAWPLAARRAVPLPQLAGIALLAACLLSFKNTTFLLVLACLAASLLLWTARLWRGGDRLRVLVATYFGVLLAIAVLAALAWWWWQRRGELPSGNTEYRLEMYAIAWRRFLDSPLWGTAFTGSTVTYFDLYKVALRTQNLPTHSDILDMLAHGGVIAIALWAATVWRVLRMTGDAFAVLSRPEPAPDEARWRWVWVLGVMQVCALITYAVNPPLISVVHAFWIWGGAGAMWALHRRLTVAEPAELIRIRPPILARRYAT